MTKIRKYDIIDGNNNERRTVMKKTCYIVGSGDFTRRDLTISHDDFVIAADGGYRYLQKIGIKPSLLVGDFDSLDFVPEGIEIFRYPSEKDDTDMGLAIEKGFDLGYTDFAIYAGSGSRADHFFANLQLLMRYSERGLKIKMVCPENNVYVLTKGEITLKQEKGTVFSVFSLTDTSENVTIKNAKYNLDGASISSRFPLGVSNEFMDENVVISVGEGVILIFEYLSPDYK